MNEIEAISISAPVFGLLHDRTLTGIIHSVFEHSVNLLSHEELITLTDERGGNLPFGICCRFNNLSLEKLFQCGETFSVENDVLQFSSSGLTISLESVKIWPPSYPRMMTCVSDTGIVHLKSWLNALTGETASLPHIRWLAKRVEGPATVPVAAEAWVGHFATQIEKLLNAVEGTAWTYAGEAIVNLLGLGIGLTPSGDDFLAGFITAGLALGPREPFWRLAQQAAGLAPARTTLVSASLFLALSREQLSERFGSLLSALEENSDGLEPAAYKMLEFGSSSGLETMYGLLYGLQVHQKIKIN